MILIIYVSDQRRTLLPRIVISSLFVTCVWQSWARGIIHLGLGAPPLCNHFVHSWCYRLFCITSVDTYTCKAAATRYVVIYPISPYECHRTMASNREPCTRRHTLLVTRTGANDYALYTYKIRGFTPTDSTITSYTHKPWHWRYFFESTIIILATVQHNWQCISWLYIDSTKTTLSC